METMPANSSSTAAPTQLPVPRDGIAGAAPYGAPQLPVTHALNVNENPFGPSRQLADHIGRAVSETALGLNRYPDREALALREERSEEHTSELQSRGQLVCRLLLEKKKKNSKTQQQKQTQ